MSWRGGDGGDAERKRRRGLTEEGADEERPQRHVDDGGGDVDEPVGEERRDPQEDDVVDQVVSPLVDLPTTRTSHATQFSDRDAAGCLNSAAGSSARVKHQTYCRLVIS